MYDYGIIISDDPAPETLTLILKNKVFSKCDKIIALYLEQNPSELPIPKVSSKRSIIKITYPIGVQSITMLSESGVKKFTDSILDILKLESGREDFLNSMFYFSNTELSFILKGIVHFQQVDIFLYVDRFPNFNNDINNRRKRSIKTMQHELAGYIKHVNKIYVPSTSYIPHLSSLMRISEDKFSVVTAFRSPFRVKNQLENSINVFFKGFRIHSTDKIFLIDVTGTNNVLSIILQAIAQSFSKGTDYQLVIIGQDNLFDISIFLVKMLGRIHLLNTLPIKLYRTLIFMASTYFCFRDDILSRTFLNICFSLKKSVVTYQDYEVILELKNNGNILQVKIKDSVISKTHQITQFLVGLYE